MGRASEASARAIINAVEAEQRAGNDGVADGAGSPTARRAPERGAYLASALPIAPELQRLFPRLDARTVFDIGSCEGEDAIRYARLFPGATVYAVEPVPENLHRIEANLASRPDLDIRVLPLALADRAGRTTLHVSSGRPPDAPDGDWDYGNKSSSLLPPLRHLEVHPWVRFDNTIEVEVDTLANVCARLGIESIDLVHLDVQGAELAVLAGAGPLLDRVGAIWLEVEAIPLYDGQPLKAEVEAFMARHGFVRMVDTVGSISGDQLYFNPRVRRPGRPPVGQSVRGVARRLTRSARRLRAALPRRRRAY